MDYNMDAKQIPVVLATGRGETSTKEYIRDISFELCSKSGVPVEN